MDRLLVCDGCRHGVTEHDELGCAVRRCTCRESGRLAIEKLIGDTHREVAAYWASRGVQAREQE